MRSGTYLRSWIMDTKRKTSQIKCESRSLLLLSQPAHVRMSQKPSVYSYNYDYNYCIQTFFIHHHHVPITSLRKLVVKVKENTRQESFGTLRPIRAFFAYASARHLRSWDPPYMGASNVLSPSHPHLKPESPFPQPSFSWTLPWRSRFAHIRRFIFSTRDQAFFFFSCFRAVT